MIDKNSLTLNQRLSFNQKYKELNLDLWVSSEGEIRIGQYFIPFHLVYLNDTKKYSLGKLYKIHNSYEYKIVAEIDLNSLDDFKALFVMIKILSK